VAAPLAAWLVRHADASVLGVVVGTLLLITNARTLMLEVGTAGPVRMAVIVAIAISVAFVAHLLEIAFWAVLFMVCGEFSEFGTAFDHSAVNYTTLGYGNVVMTPSWRLLGPLEAADGMLMFGVTTAMVFAVILRLIRARFADLRE